MSQYVLSEVEMTGLMGSAFHEVQSHQAARLETNNIE